MDNVVLVVDLLDVLQDLLLIERLVSVWQFFAIFPATGAILWIGPLNLRDLWILNNRF